jgi:hypothetical protein
MTYRQTKLLGFWLLDRSFRCGSSSGRAIRHCCSQQWKPGSRLKQQPAGLCWLNLRAAVTARIHSSLSAKKKDENWLWADLNAHHHQTTKCFYRSKGAWQYEGLLPTHYPQAIHPLLSFHFSLPSPFPAAHVCFPTFPVFHFLSCLRFHSMSNLLLSPTNNYWLGCGSRGRY